MWVEYTVSSTPRWDKQRQLAFSRMVGGEDVWEDPLWTDTWSSIANGVDALSTLGHTEIQLDRDSACYRRALRLKARGLERRLSR